MSWDDTEPAAKASRAIMEGPDAAGAVFDDGDPSAGAPVLGEALTLPGAAISVI